MSGPHIVNSGYAYGSTARYNNGNNGNIAYTNEK